jgi:hypothetical protein
MLRIPHCLDSRLTDGGKVVNPTHQLHITPQKHYFSAFGTHFCLRLSKAQGLVQPEGLGKLKNFIHLVWSRTCDLVACNVVPEQLCYHLPQGPQLILFISVNFCMKIPPKMVTAHTRLYTNTVMAVSFQLMLIKYDL